MFTAKTVTVSGGTPTELTAGINTDQEYEILLRLASFGGSGYSPSALYVGDSTVGTNGGYRLTNWESSASPSPGTTQYTSIEPELRLTLQAGTKVYALISYAGGGTSLDVDVLVHST